MKNKTTLGFYYITEWSKVDTPIKRFDSWMHACNTASLISKQHKKRISVWQWNKLDQKPQRLTTYLIK